MLNHNKSEEGCTFDGVRSGAAPCWPQYQAWAQGQRFPDDFSDVHWHVRHFMIRIRVRASVAEGARKKKCL
jgi:hypothetical protein